jgi:type IV pilus biogenesis protein PilP
VPAAAPEVAPAAEIAQAAPAGMPAAAAPIAATGGTPAEAMPSPAVVTPAPSLQPTMPSAMPSAAGPTNLPSGTPAIVGQVMENLQQSQSSVSVEDLSRAQDALTRLDLLLQIEKKIVEIKKTQDDRESGGNGAMLGQIPASALVMPGQMGASVDASSTPVMSSPVISSAPATPAASSYEIEQISGTNGSYSALLTTPEGDRKTVREGDKLDGRTVQSVSLDGVQLSPMKGAKKGGKTLTIHNDAVLLTPLAR